MTSNMLLLVDGWVVGVYLHGAVVVVGGVADVSNGYT
jgi:hypothetical protein